MNDIFLLIYIVMCVYECVFVCCYIFVIENYKEFDYIICIIFNFIYLVLFFDVILLKLK